METLKCYLASFNVGNVEVWSSELYFEKQSVLIEVGESADDIVEAISNVTFLSDSEIYESLKNAIKGLNETDSFKDKEKNFDFFILEQIVWKTIQDRYLHKSIKKDHVTIEPTTILYPASY